MKKIAEILKLLLVVSLLIGGGEEFDTYDR